MKITWRSSCGNCVVVRWSAELVESFEKEGRYLFCQPCHNLHLALQTLNTSSPPLCPPFYFSKIKFSKCYRNVTLIDHIELTLGCYYCKMNDPASIGNNYYEGKRHCCLKYANEQPQRQARGKSPSPQIHPS